MDIGILNYSIQIHRIKKPYSDLHIIKDDKKNNLDPGKLTGKGSSILGNFLLRFYKF